MFALQLNALAWRWAALLCIALFTLSACGDDGEAQDQPSTTNNTNNTGGTTNGTTNNTTAPAGIVIEGTWESSFGGEEVIDEAAWNGVTIVEYDNAERFAITQNSPDAEFSPNQFNKLVWTPIVDDAFYYCFLEFNQETAEAAKNTTKMADATNPEASGCGDFSWTKLTRVNP